MYLYCDSAILGLRLALRMQRLVFEFPDWAQASRGFAAAKAKAAVLPASKTMGEAAQAFFFFFLGGVLPFWGRGGFLASCFPLLLFLPFGGRGGGFLARAKHVLAWANVDGTD